MHFYYVQAAANMLKRNVPKDINLAAFACDALGEQPRRQLKVKPATASIEIHLRIPGKWSHPKELIERMPADFRFAPEAIVLPDGKQVEFGAMEADDQFAQIFRSSCRQAASEDELATVDGYTVNVLLSGPGGSMEAVRTMMQAGAAIVQAGGAGVFIDNSALAHGGQAWLEMTEDGGPDAMSFAFVAIIQGRAEVRTMGMHVLGLREIVMKRADADADDQAIIDVIRYVARGDRPIDNGHVIADLSGPRFQVFTEESEEGPASSPMYNPFGRMRLVSMSDIAGAN
jgi:hypothetical protein